MDTNDTESKQASQGANEAKKTTKKPIANTPDTQTDVRDEAIQALKHSNEALSAQLTHRSSLLQAIGASLSGLLTLLFAAAFLYQIVKVSEINTTLERAKDMSEQVDSARKELEAQNKAVNEQMTKQADLVAKVVQSVTLLNLGYRDLSRNREKLANGHADKIAGSLASYDLSKPDGFSPAIRELQFAALDLRARGYFNLHRRSATSEHLEQIIETADRMISLDKNRPEGYHFRGVALSEKFEPSASRHDRDAIVREAAEAYGIAMRKDPAYQVIDLTNLAETYFINEQFVDSLRAAERFAPDREDPIEQKVLRDFFLYVSSYVSQSTPGQETDTSLSSFVKSVLDARKHNSKITTNYSWKPLEGLRDRLRDGKAGGVLKPKERRKLHDAIDLLIKADSEKLERLEALGAQLVSGA